MFVNIFLQANDTDEDEETENIIDVSKSPAKPLKKLKLYNANIKCKIVDLESLENPYIIPFLFNCQSDNEDMISTSVPTRIQQNATFVLDISALGNRADLYADENGVWKMTGCRPKYYTIDRDENGRVVEMERVRNEGNADVVVRRRSYTCSSYPLYHRTIVSIEFSKDIDKWFPLVLLHYHYDGKPRKFKVEKHGNRTSSNMPYLRTKTSTKRSIAEKAQQYGPKRALFQVRKEAGGVCGVDSTGTLPRNENQVKYIKKKQQEPGPANKDPLASVMELQKTTFRGFIREIVCNDLPTVMLFTDRQLNNIVKFCCHKRSNQVSELGVDLTFQLGPFYLLVTSYRNTVLQVKGTNRHPSCIGPVMICMTKEESTYLSFIHCLNREIPGLSQHLHATGTDDECALKNALAAGFQHAAPLLCYIHSERNVKAKGRKLGLSSALVERICQDLYRQGSGLIWSSSREQFDARAAVLMKEWETLERSEKGGPPMFAEYFRAHKLEDMQTRMSKYVMKNLGLGDKPYQQNIPESINDMLKDWANFVPQDMDKFIVTLYDFVESFDQEEELAWFQLSDKWEICPQFQQHLSGKSHGEMTPEERKAFMRKVEKVCPDPAAYKRCRSFKFKTATATSAESSSNQMSCDISDLAQLDGEFSREEQASLLEKAKSILYNAKFREGFQEGVFFVDSEGPLPHRVQCLKSGKCSCGCNFFSRNNLCFHSLAVAIHRDCVQKVVQAYKGRSLNKITTATAPKNVGAKAPSRKRPLDDVVMESSTQVEDTAPGSHLQAEVLNPTTLLIRKSARPVDPPSSAPLVLKEITGNIRKCAGCLKSITSAVVGYQDADDQRCCFARFEAYHFWNKATNRWQLTTSTRHYHLNPVCTKMSGKESSVNIKASLVMSEGLQQLVRARFDYDLSS